MKRLEKYDTSSTKVSIAIVNQYIYHHLGLTQRGEKGLSEVAAGFHALEGPKKEVFVAIPRTINFGGEWVWRKNIVFKKWYVDTKQEYRGIMWGQDSGKGIVICFAPVWSESEKHLLNLSVFFTVIQALFRVFWKCIWENSCCHGVRKWKKKWCTRKERDKVSFFVAPKVQYFYRLPPLGNTRIIYSIIFFFSPLSF